MPIGTWEIHARAAAMSLPLLTLAGAALPQVAAPPGQDAPELREPRFAPESAPRFELPPLPQAPPDRLGSGPKVLVRRVEIVGNTALPEGRLRELARPYEGREVTIEELFRLKDEITLAYVERGFINSGAVLPDQDVGEGTVRFEIVEGELEAVDVTGARHLSPGFLARRIRLGGDRPLDVEALQERLRLLLLEPTVARLDARLLPGSGPGKARLEVAVEENRPVSVELRAASDASPSIGGERGVLALTWRGPLGRNDPLELTVGATEGLRQAGFGYSVPLTAGDLRLHVEGEYNDAEVVDDDLEELEIESRSRRLAAGLAMPVHETVANRVGLDLSLERRRDRNFLLDEPFSFSPGERRGQSDLALLRFTQDWQHRGRDRAVSAASTFTAGLDALGATDGPEPDGQFLAWLGQVEVAHRLLGEEDQVVLRGAVQLSNDPLLPVEQLTLGGLDSVRGYRVNEVVRDQGWSLSLEYRLPVLGRLVPETARRSLPEGASLELAPFVDSGGGRNRDGPNDSETLVSAGLGLRFALPPRLNAEVYWGLPLTGRDESSADPIQDAGVGFRVRVGLY